MRLKEIVRYELKYVISRAKADTIATHLTDYMNPDSYGDERGHYPITSVYYDSPDYRAYWDKIEGHRFRRKVRVRVYGNQQVEPETTCFLEIKQRNNKALEKRRIIMPCQQAEQLCGLGEPYQAPSPEVQAVADEVLYLQNTLDLQPACVISYNRLAFNGSNYDPGLRVTFDTNLRYRMQDLTLLATGQSENYFFVPPDWCIMEVKVNYRVPYWLTEMIGQYQCTFRRISKYCTGLEQAKVVFQTQNIVL